VWPVICEWIGRVLSVLLCAVAVKLFDDFLDVERDRKGDCYNFTYLLGKGTPIYAALALALAGSIYPGMSLPLFFASYSIGMFHDLRQSFPSGLSGLQESFFVFFLGVLLWGWQGMLFSLFFIFSIQLFDDYLDSCQDQLAGYRNFAHRLGKTECLLLAIVTLLISWWLDEFFFFPTLLATLIFYSGIFLYQRGKPSCY